MNMNVVKRIWRAWIRLLEKIAWFQLRIIFTILYFTFISVFALLFKIIKKSEYGWIAVSKGNDEMEKARWQF